MKFPSIAVPAAFRTSTVKHVMPVVALALAHWFGPVPETMAPVDREETSDVALAKLGNPMLPETAVSPKRTR